jgi:hypothetical protein
VRRECEKARGGGERRIRGRHGSGEAGEAPREGLVGCADISCSHVQRLRETESADNSCHVLPSHRHTIVEAESSKGFAVA